MMWSFLRNSTDDLLLELSSVKRQIRFDHWVFPKLTDILWMAIMKLQESCSGAR